MPEKSCNLAKVSKTLAQATPEQVTEMATSPYLRERILRELKVIYEA
jgi:hypothetical protein